MISMASVGGRTGPGRRAGEFQSGRQPTRRKRVGCGASFDSSSVAVRRLDIGDRGQPRIDETATHATLLLLREASSDRLRHVGSTGGGDPTVSPASSLRGGVGAAPDRCTHGTRRRRGRRRRSASRRDRRRRRARLLGSPASRLGQPLIDSARVGRLTRRTAAGRDRSAHNSAYGARRVGAARDYPLGRALPTAGFRAPKAKEPCSAGARPRRASRHDVRKRPRTAS
jgi:hypothetical protein